MAINRTPADFIQVTTLDGRRLVRRNLITQVIQVSDTQNPTTEYVHRCTLLTGNVDDGFGMIHVAESFGHLRRLMGY